MTKTERVVIVTGAGSGLGRAMAVGLLRHGMKVVLAGRKRDWLEETLRESGVPDAQALIMPTDLLKQSDRERLCAASVEKFRHVDVLVNNAGIMLDYVRENFRDPPVRFWEISPQMLGEYFEINAVGPHALSVILAPAMMARKWGRIINVTTSLNTMLKQLGYGGSKAALEAHTAVMAADLAGSGVTANVLIPGGRAATKLKPGENTSRMVKPDAMLPPLLWLVSDKSASANGRRFNASKWDANLAPSEAARIAGADVAWTGFGDQAIAQS